MENQSSRGAQFLILRENQHGKATAFINIPIEFSTLAASNLPEVDFVKEGKEGFILDQVTDESATIRFLNNSHEPLTIVFGKTELFKVGDIVYTIELWAVRCNAPTQDQWKISFS